jgi:hypothetical protein
VFKTRYSAKDLLGLGLSDNLVQFVMEEPRNGIFEYRCEGNLVTSQLVINEASAGDPGAVADRLKLLAGVPLMPITDEARPEEASRLFRPTVNNPSRASLTE